jgi:hypothetical protein
MRLEWSGGLSGQRGREGLERESMAGVKKWIGTVS